MQIDQSTNDVSLILFPKIQLLYKLIVILIKYKYVFVHLFRIVNGEKKDSLSRLQVAPLLCNGAKHLIFQHAARNLRL